MSTEDLTHTEDPFPPGIAAVLAEADRAIQSLSGGGHHALYQSLRLWASRLAPADAFYVGFYAPGRTVSFPYSFDSKNGVGREYDDPSAIPYGEDGLSAWMLRHARPYWSGGDGGRLLRRGQRFGDTEQLSADVIVVPIFDHSPFDSDGPFDLPDTALKLSVTGLMSMQSYSPGSYDAVTVRAFAFLSGSLSTVLSREREDGRRRASLGNASPAPPASPAEEVTSRLGALRRGIEEASRLVPAGAGELAEALSALGEDCARAQTELAELLAGPSLRGRAGDPLAGLTGRQREVALLLSEGLSAKQIAARLGVTAHTARDHVAAVRERLGVTGRSGLAAHLRRALHADGK